MNYTSYIYQLRLNKAQKERIDNWIKISRYLYNTALRTKIWAWEGARLSLSCYDLQKQITEVRNTPELAWVADLPSEVCATTMERLDKAYSSFFNNLKNKTKTDRPKFAKQSRYQSINFKNIKHVGGYRFKLPKLGTVRIEDDTIPATKTRTATIRKANGKYYLSVVFEIEFNNFNVLNFKNSVGLDMGLMYFCADSSGKFFEKPLNLKPFERRLRVLNRKLSRQKKGSTRWKETVRLLNKHYQTATNIRKHYLNQVSNYYVRKYDVIVIEDLQVKNMVKNKKLSKHILNASWSMFANMLKYKCERAGKKLIRVAPQYTSQTCFECGHVEAESRKAEKFVCVNCGHIAHADTNAAKNILQRADEVLRALK